MNHSVIVPFAQLEKKQMPIIEIARLVINFYRRLAKRHAYFNRLFFVSDNCLYDSISLDTENAVELLAEEILNENLEDIKKKDKVENPDLNYSRKSGVLFSIKTLHDETVITLNYTFSTIRNSSIGLLVVNQQYFESFEDFYFLLESINNTFDVLFSAIKLSDNEYRNKVRGYKQPLGWITYFAKDNDLLIPDDLKWVEYKYTDKGKYLILTRDDITKDAETFQFNKNKLLDIMEEIKRRVPEYSK